MSVSCTSRLPIIESSILPQSPTVLRWASQGAPRHQKAEPPAQWHRYGTPSEPPASSSQPSSLRRLRRLRLFAVFAERPEAGAQSIFAGRHPQIHIQKQRQGSQPVPETRPGEPPATLSGHPVLPPVQPPCPATLSAAVLLKGVGRCRRRRDTCGMRTPEAAAHTGDGTATGQRGVSSARLRHSEASARLRHSEAYTSPWNADREAYVSGTISD